LYSARAGASEPRLELRCNDRPHSRWQDLQDTGYHEYTWDCLAILVYRKIKNQRVIALMFNLFIFGGIPEHIRSDDSLEFTSKAVRRWLTRLGVKTLFIEPGSPWENGCIESFNGKLRDELLNREIFTTLEEAQVLIEQWQKEYNQMRPYSALRYRPPVSEAILIMT
jgi:putative transposase